MPDVFSKAKRSEIMSKVRGRGNLATEVRLMEIFRRFKLQGWKRNQKLFGKPDFVFYDARLAVFVDGCFWHGCKIHRSIPKSNRAFWSNKIVGNVRRDAAVRRTLNAGGWSVLRIWQHDLRNPDKVGKRVSRTLSQRRSRGSCGR
ncbi:DNA mismatch endonuclease Vsr [Bradyrhizobium manausense]|uniref:very short patch repair endonuclease n=1 Tax=Bradyrhizobium manausense TaxID=989370 RepID=UPI001BABE8A3|nr:DNA mismatch endonuclease Vsr [Bradyrhizobium manausense]